MEPFTEKKIFLYSKEGLSNRKQNLNRLKRMFVKTQRDLKDVAVSIKN